jgi:thioesterase domain-containing protein
MTDRRGVLALRAFRTALGPAQPIYGIEAIEWGRDGRTGPSIDAIAARSLVAVRERQERGPYFLGGHSLGGLVAYAMACKLEAAGERVGLLTLLDTVAPESVGWRGKLRARRRELRLLDGPARAALLVRLAFKVGRRALRSVYRAPSAGRSPLLRGFDDPYDIERVEQLLLGYRPAALRAPIVVLSTRDSTMRAGRPTLGWERIAAAPIEVVAVPGAHISVLATPDVDALSAALASLLEREQESA